MRSTSREWRLILSPPLPGAWNMAIDEALQATVRTTGVPVLRFYAWSPPAVSVGYFQDVKGEVDLAACAAAGVDVVRRTTGGRAVLHADEITYAVVLPLDYPDLPSGVVPSYRWLSSALVAGLQSIGIPADFTTAAHTRRHARHERLEPYAPKDRLAAHERQAPPDLPGSDAACFAAPSWYEVAVNGRKVVGSAQTRRGGALLQHGSLLLRLDVGLLCNLLRFPNEATRTRAAGLLAGRAVGLADAVSELPATSVLIEALAAGFTQALGVRLNRSELTPTEQALSARLAQQHRNPAWLFDRNDVIRELS